MNLKSGTSFGLTSKNHKTFKGIIKIWNAVKCNYRVCQS